MQLNELVNLQTFHITSASMFNIASKLKLIALFFVHLLSLIFTVICASLSASSHILKSNSGLHIVLKTSLFVPVASLRISPLQTLGSTHV